jgi:hypothetical protein
MKQTPRPDDEDELIDDEIFQTLHRIDVAWDTAARQYLLVQIRQMKRLRAKLTPYWTAQLDRFVKQLPRERQGASAQEWDKFVLEDDTPSKTPALRLVVNNKPKPPAPKTTPRWRPDHDDGPQAA